MIYTLMHKNIKVIDLDIKSDGYISKTLTIYNKNHLPYGIESKLETEGKRAFINWLSNRSIPTTRDSVNNLTLLPNENISSIVLKSRAISLSDQYWLKERDENIKWEDINFFENDFSYELGDLLIGKSSKNKISFVSPDASSNGDLLKRWMIINGSRVLLKSGTKPYNYEVFGEIISSILMTILNISHADYFFLSDDERIYSCSRDFVDFNHDFVSMYQIYESKKKNSNTSNYDFIMELLKDLNIPGYKEEMNKMLFIDYLVGNSDRHLNNFGVLRNAKTLEFETMAPIFDTGSSLGFDMTDRELMNAKDINWKPFKTKSINNQLDLIDDYSWLNVKQLDEVHSIVSNICDSLNDYISESRKEAILSFIDRRILSIKERLDISDDVSLSKLDIKIIDYIKQNKIIEKIDDISNKFNKSHITIQRSLSKLIRLKYIERIGSNKTGYYKTR